VQVNPAFNRASCFGNSFDYHGGAANGTSFDEHMHLNLICSNTKEMSARKRPRIKVANLSAGNRVSVLRKEGNPAQTKAADYRPQIEKECS